MALQTRAWISISVDPVGEDCCFSMVYRQGHAVGSSVADLEANTVTDIILSSSSVTRQPGLLPTEAS